MHLATCVFSYSIFSASLLVDSVISGAMVPTTCCRDKVIA